MKPIKILLVLVSFETVVYAYNRERINEGAGTSSDLTQCERCEVFGYAETMVRLMLAEDRNGGTLTDMMNNHFDELSAFHDEIFSTLVLAEHGARIDSDITRCKKRRKLYIHYIKTMILETIRKACTDHYDLKLWYEYDSERNTILVRENVSFAVRNNDDRSNTRATNCLCENERERNMLSESLLVPEPNHPESVLQFNIFEDETTVTETKPYHIIPLSLITKFFRVWLSDERSSYLSARFGDCVLTLFGRIRRTMQKLLIVQMKNSHIFSKEDQYNIAVNVQSNENDTFFAEMFGRAYTWLNGNIFLGPHNRGPFSPEFGMSDERALITAFELDVEPIIGGRHFRESLDLFHELMIFVLQAPVLDAFEKLLRGFELFNFMMTTLVRYDITRMSAEQWEFREPTDEELRDLGTEQSTRKVRNKKFWAIKKSSRRFPRSAEYLHYELAQSPEDNKPLSLTELKNRWSEFVADLMKITMEPRNRDESLIWSCNFTRLYNEYLFNNKKLTNGDCSTCYSFDEYLYSKISLKKCNYESEPRSDWCLAWRRISMKFGLKFDYFDIREETRVDNLRSESHLKDVEILMRWLSMKIGRKEVEKTHSREIILPKNPFKPRRTSGNFPDSLLCYLTTLTSTLILRRNDCQKVLG